MSSTMVRRSGALAAVRRLREVRREQARVQFARAIDQLRSAASDRNAAVQRRTDQVADAEKAFSRQPDVQVRTRWLEHLQVLENHVLKAAGCAAAAAGAVDDRRRRLIASDAELKAAEVLAARVMEDRARAGRRREARERDDVWLARSQLEEARC